MVAQTQMPAIMNPRNYIEKVSLTTGEVLEDEIHPKQLLVGYHRDNHVVDVSAQVLMSQLVDATGNEELTRQLMKQVRKVGHTAAVGCFRRTGSSGLGENLEAPLWSQRQGLLLSLQEASAEPRRSQGTPVGASE